MSFKVHLTKTQHKKLMKKVKGKGGFQSFINQLQSQVVTTHTLVLSFSDIRRLLIHTQLYGDGGFQNKLKGILK